MSRRGDVVLDPFGGSGTTALEALRLGRRAVSVDANPLSALIGRVKTARIGAESRAQLRSLRALVAGHLDKLPQDDHAFLKSFGDFVPSIPNIQKWFPPSSCGELALVRSACANMNGTAQDVAQLALSRVVAGASFQDSETRYASRPRKIPIGKTLAAYLAALDALVRRVDATSAVVRYGVATFRCADARNLQTSVLPECSVDLIVTSPPYGNATDYHLYHRFRLFWLGFDPRDLAGVEIGSHLRHQRDGTGFAEYLNDLLPCIEGAYRVLRPGCYAVFVLGDSVYGGVTYNTAEEMSRAAEGLGFETDAIITRPIHETRRSFVAAARRATSEKLLILKRPLNKATVGLVRPKYRLWNFEETLRDREFQSLVGAHSSKVRATIPASLAGAAKRLTFTVGLQYPGGAIEPTWQKILENGYDDPLSRRKDPKYVSHGIHPYKGKFYPQLAKSLLNLVGVEAGATVLDPFCGSGTALLEARLNGLRACGCDLNPLAAKIARAKVGILDVDPDLVLAAVGAVREALGGASRKSAGELEQFPESAHDEILSWFARPIATKLNTVLRTVRESSTGVLREYLEVILSSIIRDISHQDPRDLRIRRRKEPLKDADVSGQFLRHLDEQMNRLEHFWATRGFSPFPFPEASVVHGDARGEAAYSALGAESNSVDCVLTSPPYATALPYIDTDRLSLLLLFGLTSTDRRPLEMDLTGSREITTGDRKSLEAALGGKGNDGHLPTTVIRFLQGLLKSTRSEDVGFRKRNRPSLLLRFFGDMAAVLTQCVRVMRPGADMLLVVGDSTTQVNGRTLRIPTTDFIRDTAVHQGLTLVEELRIDVTTENLLHNKNAITENRVVRVRKVAV